MKNSFIRKIAILLAGVLITSLLFFVAMSLTYKALENGFRDKAERVYNRFIESILEER